MRFVTAMVLLMALAPFGQSALATTLLTGPLQRVTASTPEFEGQFGGDISVLNDLAVVGAPPCCSYVEGDVYVFNRDPLGAWDETQRVVSNDLTLGDGFGFSVEIIDDSAFAVGAPLVDDQEGAVYIFELHGGAWVQTHKLKASSPLREQFGRSLSIHEDLMAVGAPVSQRNTGAVYLFERTATGWVESDRLTPSDPSEESDFGSAIKLVSTTLAVGAERALGYQGLQTEGAIYIFELRATGWTEVQKLVANESAFLGRDIDLEAGVLVAGGQRTSTPPSPIISGMVVIYEKDQYGTWSQVQRLVASDPASTDVFGGSLSLLGDSLAVGAMQAFPGQKGAVYLFEKTVTGWLELGKIVSPPDESTVPFPAKPNFGAKVVLTPTELFVSAPRRALGALDKAGSVDVFDRLRLEADSLAPRIDEVSLIPNPIPLGSTSTLTAVVTDDASGVAAVQYSVAGGAAIPMSVVGDTASALVGSSLPAGVYEIAVTAQDLAGNWSDATRVYLVVYDPNGGFASGGGWITPGAGSSDPGDLLPGLDGASRANFGFVVKYQSGAATVPSGKLTFHYNVSGFHLRSTDMDWLVVTNSNWAKFRGTATVDGLEGLFSFRVDARDDDSSGDRMVIKVWASGDDPNVDKPLYKASGDIGGGNIKIHN